MKKILTAKLIRDKFAEDIKLLQSICKHPETSWMEQWWAPGHSTGNTVLVCHICEKTLKTKRPKRFKKLETGKRHGKHTS